MTVGVPPPRPPRAEPRRVRVEYEVEEREGRWLLDEEDMPEIPLHDAVIQLLELVLAAFAEREARSALITSNLGCRWDPADARVGVDPDVLLVEPMPPEGEKTTTLRVWEPGHAPPRVAVEVVSEQSGRKDYVEGPARYARLGAHELWIFDPLLVGPSDTGGPFVLQVWRRNERGAMAREHAGAGPARSEELGAWLVVTDGGTRLRLADDPLGERLWLTKAEAASRQAAAESRRAEAESRRAEAESRRADEQRRLLDAAEAEVARLRAELARRGPLGARSEEEVRGGPADEVEPRVAPRFPSADAGNGWRRPRGIGESSEESPDAGALELTKDGHVRA